MAKKFTLYWRDGKRQVVEGATIAAACTSAGYGGGALRALDFWSHGECSDWEWIAAERNWRPVARIIGYKAEE